MAGKMMEGVGGQNDDLYDAEMSSSSSDSGDSSSESSGEDSSASGSGESSSSDQDQYDQEESGSSGSSSGSESHSSSSSGSGSSSGSSGSVSESSDSSDDDRQVTQSSGVGALAQPTTAGAVQASSASGHVTGEAALARQQPQAFNGETGEVRYKSTGSGGATRRKKLELPGDISENAALWGLRRSDRKRKEPERFNTKLSDEASSDESEGYQPSRPSRPQRKRDSHQTKHRKPMKREHYLLNFVDERQSGSSDSDSDDEFMPNRKSQTKRSRRHHHHASAARNGSVKRQAANKKVNYKEDESSEEEESDDLKELIEEVLQPGEEEDTGECIEKVMDKRDGRIGDTGDNTTIYALRPPEKNAPIEPDEATERQYLIKWKGWSHLHNTWESEQSLQAANCRGMKKLHNYIKRCEEYEESRKSMTPEDLEYYDCQLEMLTQLHKQYTKPERVVAHRRGEDSENRPTQDYLVKWCGLPYSECTWEVSDLVLTASQNKNVIDEFLEREQSDCIPYRNCRVLRQRPKFTPLKEQPWYMGSKDLRLRDYQLIGVDWLTCSWCRNNSCILADEMGLGKTIQTVSLLNRLFHQYQLYGPFLVVVPLSTLVAWQREFANWAPKLNTIVYVGDSESRRAIREREWMHANNKIKFNCLITTYELLMKDKNFLGDINWAVLAVDEAHRLKNEDSLLYQTLSEFHTNHRLLITGTPLQNSLKELWAILHFIKPMHFQSWEEFEEKHSRFNDGDGSGLVALHKELEPFLLRRIKSNVETSLPAKVEQILRVDMTSVQKHAYRCILTRNLDELRREMKTSSLNIMMELKKCSNHTHLVSLPASDADTDRLQRIISGSGKMMLLDKLLVQLKDTGHRVLIFSQMVRMLDILAEYLSLRRFTFQRLDGSIRDEHRKQALDHFNAEGSTDFCFLLSTRAGGLGINLASADTVIIFDSDWNPQNDLQAQARAHRIGQRKQVNIYRLVTKGSVEENIIERAKKKMILDHLVIQRMDTTGRTVLDRSSHDSSSVRNFSKEEIRAILKFGAEELFKDDTEQDKKLQEMDINDILQRAERQTDQSAEQSNDLLAQFGQVANFSTMEWEKEANAETESSAAAAAAAAKAVKEKAKPVACEDEAEKLSPVSEVDKWVEKSWEEIIPEDIVRQAEEQQNEERLKKLYLPARTHRDVNYSDKALSKAAMSSKRGRGRKARDSSSSDSDSSEDSTRRKPKSRTVKKSEVQGFTNSEVKSFVRSYKKFGNPKSRLDALAVDARLTEKSPADLVRLADLLHDGCVRAEKDYDERLKTDPNFDGKKRGATLKLAGMTINTASILKREKELEPLAHIPADSEKRKNFRLVSRPKSVHWGVEWSSVDDAKLLIGMYEYGVGSWSSIKDDPHLGFADKILPADESRKPQAKHLQTRADYLLRLLAEELEQAHKRNHTMSQKSSCKGRDRGEEKKSVGLSVNGTTSSITTDSKSVSLPTARKGNKSSAKPAKSHKRKSEGEHIPKKKLKKVPPPKMSTPALFEPETPAPPEEPEVKLTEEHMQMCLRVFKPVGSALRHLQHPKESLSAEERKIANNRHLLIVGDHIEQVLNGMPDASEVVQWRQCFWDFVAMGLAFKTKTLKNMYREAAKRRETILPEAAKSSGVPVKKRHLDSSRSHQSTVSRSSSERTGSPSVQARHEGHKPSSRPALSTGGVLPGRSMGSGSHPHLHTSHGHKQSPSHHTHEGYHDRDRHQHCSARRDVDYGSRASSARPGSSQHSPSTYSRSSWSSYSHSSQSTSTRNTGLLSNNTNRKRLAEDSGPEAKKAKIL